jgi:hypothetical protein
MAFGSVATVMVRALVAIVLGRCGRWDDATPQGITTKHTTETSRFIGSTFTPNIAAAQVNNFSQIRRLGHGC